MENGRGRSSENRLARGDKKSDGNKVEVKSADPGKMRIAKQGLDGEKK